MKQICDNILEAIGHTPMLVDDRNASRAPSSSSASTTPSKVGMPSCFATSSIDWRVMPGSTESSEGVRSVPAASTTNTFEVGASARWPCSSSITISS